jgi:lipopolysaccharide exporter
LRSGALALLEKGSGLVFGLGTAMLLLRGLTKEDFAAWGVFLIITYFLEMGRSGLIQNGLVRYWAVHRDDLSEIRALSMAALALNLMFSVVSNVVLWLSMYWLAATFQAPMLVTLLPIYGITNVVMAFFYHCNFVQQANFEFRGIFWSTFLFRGVLFGWVLACWLAGWPIVLPQLAVAMLIGAVVGALASGVVAWPMLYRGPLTGRWMGRLSAYGKYVLGTNLSTMFYKNIDKLTLGNLLGPAAFAVYDAAGKITQMVETPSFSIASVVFPQSAQRMAQDGPAGIKWLYERSVGAILALILPFVALSILLAEPIVLLFAGEQYLESANVLRLTAFFGLFMPFAVQFGTILDSTGRAATNFRYTFCLALLNLVLSYGLVRQFGLFGAAYATLTTYTIGFLFMQRLLRRDFGIEWSRAFGYVPEMYRLGLAVVRRKLIA